MYAIVWRYRVRPERAVEFERIYGADGEWVQFFRRGEGYVGTRLYREAGAPDLFLTVDEWHSRTDYDRFRKANEREYGRIDRRCESLTESEECLAADER